MQDNTCCLVISNVHYGNTFSVLARQWDIGLDCMGADPMTKLRSLHAKLTYCAVCTYTHENGETGGPRRGEQRHACRIICVECMEICCTSSLHMCSCFTKYDKLANNCCTLQYLQRLLQPRRYQQRYTSFEELNFVMRKNTLWRRDIDMHLKWNNCNCRLQLNVVPYDM